MDTSLSLEVDDFDPLNQNAKQIPTVPKRSPVVLPSVSSSIPRAEQAFSNPIYPYYTPKHQKKPPSQQQTNAPLNSINNSKHDDDVELLRKYGLDRFKIQELNVNKHTTSNPFSIGDNVNSNRTNDPFLENGINGFKIQPKSNTNWTTFD